MNLRKYLIVVLSISGIAVSLAVYRRAQARVHEQDGMLTHQNEQFLELMAEHQRLSDLLTRAGDGTNHSPANEETAELQKLRAEAEALRKQTNDLAMRGAREPQTPSLPKVATRNARYGNALNVVSDSDSDEYKQQLYGLGRAFPHSSPSNIDGWRDAQNLAESFRSYANENGGQFPASFDEASSYLFKEYRAPQSTDYEIVYHGTLSELTNIPGKAVVLIRERQPWPTPNGKWGRLYATVHGSVKVVESDDNFQAWEAEHIIPPPPFGGR